MSNELKATKGPWKVANYEDSVCDDALIVDREGKEVLGSSEWARVEDADLDMMAASREMYDALEDALYKYGYRDMDSDDYDRYDSILSKARGEKS